MSKNKKTAAKRMGVKSVLRHGEENLTITTFGKGNDAEIAVQTNIYGEGIITPYNTNRFTIEDIDETIEVVHGDLESLLNNPIENPGEDYLQLKKTLENEFFGKTFDNDNIHIQIIYNILDVMKILGLYVNDIIYSVNNLQEVANTQAPLADIVDNFDIVGKSLSEDKAKTNLERMNPYLGFFGDVFILLPKKDYGKSFSRAKDQEENDKMEIYKHNKSVLRALGAARQITGHVKKFTILFSKNDDLRKKMKKEYKIDWDVVRNSYKNRVDDINDNFLLHSRVNLHILYELLGATEMRDQIEVTEEYYKFSILKEGKNLGLNMKKIRENLIDQFYPEVKEKQHDSYRQKIYAICDYLIFRYINNSEELNDMVAVLRKTSDEPEKDKLYEQFALTVKNKISGLFEKFIKQFDQGFPVFCTNSIPDEYIQNVKLKVNQTPLIELLSFLCNFMDAKEINELLSAYIHKFENIQTFIDTLKKLGENVQFTDSYGMFNDYNGCRAGRIAQDLRVLASIGKMKPDLSDAKMALYKAAIEMLGGQNKENIDYLAKQWLDDNLFLPNAPKDTKHSFRNFIANNVIESRRFFYLVRYAKPKTVRTLMNNPKIIRYVLSRLPEEQVDSYYLNIDDMPLKNRPLSDKIKALTNRLAAFTFQSILEKRGTINEAAKPGCRNRVVERLKALTGLYLTVAFVAVKNLVKINARYYIAYFARERDEEMFTRKLVEAKENINSFSYPFINNEGKDDFNAIAAITKYFLDLEKKNDYKPDPGMPFDVEACRKHLNGLRRHFTKKWRDILQKNLEEGEKINATGYFFMEHRNAAAHLTVLAILPQYVEQFRANTPGEMISYFELYHFLLQKYLCDKSLQDTSPQLDIPDIYRQNIEKFSTPCLDWIKIAYAPLGYNLPRYKNLTIEALFDKDSEEGIKRENQKKK